LLQADRVFVTYVPAIQPKGGGGGGCGAVLWMAMAIVAHILMYIWRLEFTQ